MNFYFQTKSSFFATRHVVLVHCITKYNCFAQLRAMKVINVTFTEVFYWKTHKKHMYMMMIFTLKSLILINFVKITHA